MSTERGPGWMAAKAGIAGLTAAIVLTGLAAEPDGFSIGLAAVLLVPTLVFLVGVWSPRRVMVFGALLAGITAATWILYELNKRESMAGAGIVMGTAWSLLAVLVGSVMELADRSAQKRQPGRSDADRMETEDPGHAPRRAW